MKVRTNHRFPVCILFLFSVLAGAVYARETVTNKMNGVTLRGQVIASVSVKVESRSATNFTFWTASEINVQSRDVIVASFVRQEPGSAADLKGPAAPGEKPALSDKPTGVLIKTKSSPDWVVTENKKAFVAIEDAPLLYANPAGANGMLTLEVLRDDNPVPSKHEPRKKKTKPMNVLKRK